MPQPVRLFLALDISAEAKIALAAAQLRLAELPALARIRWVRPEGTHLTLYFFGTVPPEHFATIQADCRAAVAVAPLFSFELRLDALGAFPNDHQPRVLWAGVTGNMAALQAAQSAVAGVLNQQGHRPVDHTFNPHITLGRLHENTSPADRAAAGEALRRRNPEIAAAFAAVPPFQVAGATLYRSRLQPGGSVYEPVARYGFGGKNDG